MRVRATKILALSADTHEGPLEDITRPVFKPVSGELHVFIAQRGKSVESRPADSLKEALVEGSRLVLSPPPGLCSSVITKVEIRGSRARVRTVHSEYDVTVLL